MGWLTQRDSGRFFVRKKRRAVLSEKDGVPIETNVGGGSPFAIGDGEDVVLAPDVAEACRLLPESCRDVVTESPFMTNASRDLETPRPAASRLL